MAYIVGVKKVIPPFDSSSLDFLRGEGGVVMPFKTEKEALAEARVAVSVWKDMVKDLHGENNEWFKSIELFLIQTDKKLVLEIGPKTIYSGGKFLV